jgi:RNA-directed DNA polymerase
VKGDMTGKGCIFPDRVPLNGAMGHYGDMIPIQKNELGACPLRFPRTEEEGVVDYFSLYNAWRSCRRRKRATPQAQFYEAYLLDNLIETVHALRSGHWHPCRPVCFMVDKPKAREIHAAHYRDRVVHHWLAPRLEELYEPIFIHDVYSNRKGKGTHTAVKRLRHFMRSVARMNDEPIRACVAGPRDKENMSRHEEGTGCGASRMHSHAAHGNESDENGNSGNGKSSSRGFFLQLDIKNFFNSVDRRILFSLLQKRLRKAVRQGKVDEATAVSYRDITGVWSFGRHHN